MAAAGKRTNVPEDRLQLDLFRGDPAWPPAKEFVAVPDDLLERTDELAPYLERSLAYVLTLKPKATKRANSGR
jgi:hypothetical protein